ncbi:hypothetical protein [Emcibacter sp. SYSU 3D8]|uniref:hypothetical protein n=1 Tax=Emcibacter sp. SYSU 3D8 TaxID=3133969 RepID=UPI0031FE8F24
MFDTAMFILFCIGPALAAFVALRLEHEAGGRKRRGWKPTPHGQNRDVEGGSV